MTLLSSGHRRHGGAPRSRRSHLVPILMSGVLGLGAIAAIAWLLRPTWGVEASSEPGRLPVSVGATLFNVPTKAIRMSIQKHSGPQERVDLSYLYPSLQPPDAPKRVSMETFDEKASSIDRIFLSISAHHGVLAPEVRIRAIYPRYLDQPSAPAEDGLSIRAFRAGTPYENEDLLSADTPNLTARCTRDGDTPGMCISERRIEGADLMFRFPRAWLAQWRDVSSAMERLSAQVNSPQG